MTSTKKNIGYQTIYQLLITCIPLITAPYLSRVLGASRLGMFSYTSSIVNYFTLFAMLGVVNYGSKSISAVKDNQIKLSKTFSEIYTMQLFNAIALCSLYVVYILFFCTENRDLATIQLISVFGCMIDVNWLFFGIEKFKLTVTRNCIIKVTSVIMIIWFVKEPTDLWKYALINVLGNLFSQAILWLFVPKVVTYKVATFKQFCKHYKMNLTYFWPLLAMSVYHIMDKTMLGIMSDYQQSGFYYNADKIVNIVVGVISGIGTVMLPRMTALVTKGNKEEAEKLFSVSLVGTTAAASAMTFGIVAIADDFVSIFFGNGYDGCIPLIVLLAPVIIVKSYSFTVRYQYLMPNGYEKNYTISVVLGAIVNLIVNLLLIPQLGAMGAVIGTLLAESIACIYQYLFVISKNKSVLMVVACSLMFILGGGIMLFSVKLISLITIKSIIMRLAIKIFVGASVYILFCILYLRISKNSISHSMAKYLKMSTKNGGDNMFNKLRKYEPFNKIYMCIYNAFFGMLTLISPKLNTKVHYLCKYKKRLNLRSPKSLHEKLLWLKVYQYNKDPLVTQCADKYLVRQYVSDLGYENILNELIGVWNSADEIDWEQLPEQFVLKWNFGAGMNIVCKDKSKLSKEQTIKRLKKWGKCKYWLPNSEMQYKYCEKKIICEKYLEDTNNQWGIIPDYKVYCIHGQPYAVFLMHDRGHEIKTEFFDVNWKPLANTNKYPNTHTISAPPKCLSRMISASKALSQPFPFVRCDFYVVNNNLIFGEMTFTPAGGLYTSTTELDGKDLSEYLTIDAGI